MKIIIKEEQSGLRIDNILKHEINKTQTISRVDIQNLVKNKTICLNSSSLIKNSNIVKTGDVIEVDDNVLKDLAAFRAINENIAPNKDIKIKIVYENENLIIINKPKNLTVHPGAGNFNNTLVNGLLSLIGENSLSNIRGNQRYGIVHRLDKDTTGLMIVAKNNQIHQLLCNMMKNNQIEKKYLALCHGKLTQLSGIIQNYICRDSKNIQKMKISDSSNLRAKLAITHYNVIKFLEDDRYTLLECKLETGRTHQIRLHLLHLQHPVVGDQIYNMQKYRSNNSLSFKSQALHSYSLSFIEPITKEHINIINYGNFKKYL